MVELGKTRILAASAGLTMAGVTRRPTSIYRHPPHEVPFNQYAEIRVNPYFQIAPGQAYYNQKHLTAGQAN